MSGSIEPPSPRVVDRVEHLDFDVRQTARRPRETRVLMGDPLHYAVEYAINPHMQDHVGSVDSARARRQWEALRDTYRDLGFEVHVLPPEAGLPDLVFTANPSFPATFPDGRWGAVLSRMAHAERRPETALTAAWYAQAGGAVRELELPDAAPDALIFEGMGDALWLPGRRLVIGGHGFRTDPRVYEQLARVLEVPVLTLALLDERFYHLDTCLSLLDEQTALYAPEAFDERGRSLLEAVFPRLVPLPLEESEGLFACNGHAPDGRHFLVQSGCVATGDRVRDLGFEVIELDTSEFLKSGGSVFCMKLMLP
jgi:N-dimethylarginine dimethylaminohydrolase